MAIGEWTFPTTTYAGITTGTFTLPQALFPQVSTTSTPITFKTEPEEPKTLSEEGKITQGRYFNFDERAPRGHLTWAAITVSVADEALEASGDEDQVLQHTAQMALDEFYRKHENDQGTVWDTELKLYKWHDEDSRLTIIQVEAPVLKR